MSIQPNEGITTLLPPGSQDSVLTLRYGSELLSELHALTQNKNVYDVIIVDTRVSGFLFAAEVLLEAVRAAGKLLALHGSMVFAGVSQTIVLVRLSLQGDIAVYPFDNSAQLYDYSPSLAVHVQAACGLDAASENTDLSEQVLSATIPVLTAFGIKLKASMESSRRRNLVLGAIDNYTPLSALLKRTTDAGVFSKEQILEELRSLEQTRAVFPIFPKVPFLVHCYRNQTSIQLRDYLIAAELVNQETLEQLAFEQKNVQSSARLNLGPLCISKGLLTTRALEIALQDLSFYGQVHEGDAVKMSSGANEPRQVQSLVGHLGTTDPAGLLQSLASNRESGVLSVEHRDLQFRAYFEKGRLSHAKVGKIKGNSAIIELVSVWGAGVFVFIQRDPPADLKEESCQVTKPLDKLLLDSALASDNIEVVWKKLAQGANSPLEKLADQTGILTAGQILDPVEKTALSPKQVELMQTLWKACDGLTTITNLIRALGDVTTAEGAAAVDRLLAYRLISVPAMDISAPLDKFRQITGGVGEKLGQERNVALLKLSLQATQGYSVRARMFTIGSSGEVGLDLAAAKSSGASLSSIMKELEDWQVKYIEYVSQELDRNVLRDIVYKVHHQS